MDYARRLYLIFDAIENYSKVENAYTRQKYDNYIENFNASKIACKILMSSNKEDPPVIRHFELLKK